MWIGEPHQQQQQQQVQQRPQQQYHKQRRQQAASAIRGQQQSEAPCRKQHMLHRMPLLHLYAGSSRLQVARREAFCQLYTSSTTTSHPIVVGFHHTSTIK
jgi:hypothetical protein